MRRLSYGLSRELWLVEAGIFLNMLGYGAVLPFEVIYLHEGRGLSFQVAGLVVGTVTGAAVVVAPLAGTLIDRLGARRVAAGAGVALALGYAALGFIQSPAQALAAALLAGVGNGALIPSQSTLLASLAAPELRHRATAVSRVAANGGMGLGAALGGLVAAQGLNGFVALFLANAVTYVAYVAVLLTVVREEARPERVPGGYRVIFRDRAFVHLALTNLGMIAVGWGVFTWLMPPYAKSELGIPAGRIGLLLFANALTVVVAQVPVAKLAEGRRRMALMAWAGLLFAAASLLVAAASGLGAGLVYPALVAAVVAVAVGECLHTAVLMPLVADLAPRALRGRYMAAMGFSWWLGLALAPIAGAPLLGASPRSAFVVAAGVALAATLSALALERELPVPNRITPRPASSSG
jgi:MFS family permease